MNKKQDANTAPPLNAPTGRAAKAALRPAKAVVTRNERCCVHEYWAVVETNGTLVRGRNVVSVKRLAQGQYEVIFSGDVSQGVYVATIGRPGIFVEPAGQIGVALRFGSGNKGVWVDTHDSVGNYSDRAFHLVVHVD
jgi:hypothetical protein